MIKARSRKLSLLLVFAMLMTMFIGVGTASAAVVDYSAYGVPTVQTENDFTQTLGSIVIEVDQGRYLNGTQNWVTLKMPSGVKIQNVAGEESVTVQSADNVTAQVYYQNSTTVDLLLDGAGVTTPGAESTVILDFNYVKVQSGSGNLDVTFVPQSGSILPGGTLTIANIVSKGATEATISVAKSLSDGANLSIGDIYIAELSPNVFKNASNGDTIEIELPDGVEWNKTAVAAATVSGAWDFSSSAVISNVSVDVKSTDDSVLLVKFAGPVSSVSGKAGRLDISGLAINIDEDDASKGEIKAKISSDNIDGVTKQDLVIAKFGDYAATVTANETTQLIAGQNDQELGSFYIEESLNGSLIQGRTIVLELPSGVKWTTPPELTVEKGDLDTSVAITSDNKVKITIDTASGSAAKVLVEEGEVYVEPGFSGDVELEVSGTAGLEGTVKVAEAVKAVEVTASSVPNIIIGEQNVLAGDIVIKEAVAEAIQEGDIVIELAGGYEFYKEPTVKVTEGDLKIDDVDINSDEQLVISIDKESNEPSTITISDIYVTGYRYAPTGPVVAKIVEAEGNASNAEGSTALDSLYQDPKTGDKEYSEKSVGEVTIANCVTPAEGAGVAEFKIGSNIYYVGGVAKVMDVAPYIKGDRSYVPMRYVAEMLGAEVVWDDAARTVTLTKDDTTVVFTIGSTAYTVNGESMTADVAPEIANDRTMLPARYVAEALGAVVGWDAGTQTVIVQQ